MKKNETNAPMLGIAAFILILAISMVSSGGPTGNAIAATNPPSSERVITGMGASVYTLSASDDAQGARSGYEYCKSKGETCVQVEWAYKQGACTRTSGWCGLSESNAEIKHFSCFSGGLIGPTFDGAAKRIYCAENIGGLTGNQQAYTYWVVDPDVAPYSTGNQMCEGQGPLKCVAVDWLYHPSCPNGGWCGPEVEQGNWRQFPCDLVSLNKPQFKGAIARVLCRLGP